MNKKEVLSEIDKNIKSCQVVNDQKEAEIIILELEKLISQYNAEDEDEKRFKRNRLTDIEKLKNTIRNPNEGKLKVQNVFYGRVEMIDLADCERWIVCNQADLQSTISSINVFIKKFPFQNNSLETLNINEYILGTGRETFCWHLENGTPGEMGQRSSFDYYMYWSAKDDAFAIKDSNHKKIINIDEARRIFSVLKGNLEKMLMLAESGKIDKIDKQRRGLQLPKSNILQKILFLYLPEKFIGYYSNRYIKKIAAMLNINVSTDVFQTNYIIAENIKNKISNPAFSETDKTVGFTIYLWHKWNDYIRQTVG